MREKEKREREREVRERSERKREREREVREREGMVTREWSPNKCYQCHHDNWKKTNNAAMRMYKNILFIPSYFICGGLSLKVL